MTQTDTALHYDYLRDPDAITARSFEIVRDLVDLSPFHTDLHGLVVRLIHACGMPDVVGDLVVRGDLIAAASRATAIYVDSNMVQAGISRPPNDLRVQCTIKDPAVERLAAQYGTTRSAAAVELWRPHLDRAVVAIGNAPTALFHLLERLEVWRMRPLAILAFPVGFVGAAESKEALIDADLGIPFATLRGRRGGSAMAAAAVNALLSQRRSTPK
ncbi:MAG: precorrin-8X methylmutase [Pseudomonadota bacterium]